MINSQAKALLDLMATLNVPPMQTMTPAQARQSYLDRGPKTQPAASEVSLHHDYFVDVDGHQMKIRAYRPNGVDAQTVLPALLFLHGGGWTIGDCDSHDTLCRSLSNRGNCAVYSVDYRMGPESKFPTAVNDTMVALHWLVANAKEQFVDVDRIAVGGDSAGGNLAAVASLIARDQAGPAICFQLLIYPATDQRATSPSHVENGEGYLLTKDLMNWFRNQYHSDEQEYHDWRASPLLADNHKDLPPALVLTAGFDPLRDEGNAYANTLEKAGVAVERVHFAGQIHGFILMGRVIDEAEQAVDCCAKALNGAWSA